ncbi:hypothetical protein [Pedobacter steynii]|uniref:Uncharacterized protein n=1 Tax=Pedobacter steynii TaxID=430522 RepID=A0A1D7QG96_9SPHI|nr:hypothetical protein [Pedobacter steynii]AOM77712.1 hypothetical protein BFS30_11340 [Pedobacter steynii]
MNLDELKEAWTNYGGQLRSAKDIDDQVIENIIRKKSVSVVATIQKSYRYGILFCTFYLLLSIALNTGNPFDYTTNLERLPVYVISCLLILILVVLFRADQAIKKLNFHRQSLLGYLEAVIKTYAASRKILLWIIYTLLFCTSVLFPLSFLPRKIAASAAWPGLISTFGLFICLVLFNVGLQIIARKKGLGDRSWYSFKVIILELEALRLKAAELKSN